MAVLDTPVRKAAQNVIARFGKKVVYRGYKQRRYDTAEADVKGEFDEEIMLRAVVGRVSEREAAGSGGSLRKGDLRLTMAAKDLSVEPTTEGEVEFNGSTYGVVEIEPTHSGDEVAIYTLFARR